MPGRSMKSLSQRNTLFVGLRDSDGVNEEQAAAYQAQIDARLRAGRLPSETVYQVLPDPDGKRVGSGGATFM